MQEIKAAKWMQVDEYANTEFAQSHATIKEFVRCMRAYQDGSYAAFGTMELPGLRGGRQLIVHGLGEPPDAS